MAKHRIRVGLHARNTARFPDPDYELVRRARIETLKTMSYTEPAVYQRLRQQNPGLEFIVRLYDDRIHYDSRATTAEFVAKMVPIINALKPYAQKFEIHNEPNHSDRLEGWGPGDADARSFLGWYMKVLPALKKACPWGKFGFPGLAINKPHRDLEWLEICREGVEASDWLGCHTYWQGGNMLSDEWGLRFKLYHLRFPEARIEITEFGNSTPGVDRGAIAEQYVRYYHELGKFYYLNSASAFIASSPDPAWATFVWMLDGGSLLPVVDAVGNMERKEVEAIRDRYFRNTGHWLRGTFLEFFEKYGLDICGYPVTDEFMEGGLRSQYLGRVALEEPEPGKVRLKSVGREAWTSRSEIATLKKRVAELDKKPVPALKETVADLRAIVEALQGEIDSLEAELKALQDASAPGGSPATVTAVQQIVEDLRDTRDDLKGKLDAVMAAVGEEPSETIAALEAQIKALQDEIRRLKAQEPPAPAAGEVARPSMKYLVGLLPTHATERYKLRALNAIETLVIHHSATGPTVLPEAIAKYHVEKRSWPGIGYHFLVDPHGTVYQTNDMETVSNQAANMNTRSLGICFLGNFMEETPSADQLEGGSRLVAWVLQELGLELETVKGHKEYMQTACPGNQWLEGQHWKEALVTGIVKLQEEAAQRKAPAPRK